MNFVPAILAIISASAFAMTPTKKAVIEETKSNQTSTIKPNKVESSKKKFKPKHTLQEDIKEAELLEKPDETSP